MPKLQIPKKLERILTTKARLIVLIGGRSSGKSEGIARILTMKCQTEQADILCGREFQNSIDESVHKLIKEVIGKTEAQGFNISDKKIDCNTGGCFRFKGFSRNPEAVKSAQGFKYSWVEESDVISQKTIDDLLPTIRAADSKLFFTANPQSSEDPFSKRFINPFLDRLTTDGYYEDDMHLIIFMNYADNPWHGELEPQRIYDFKHYTRAKYDHIWMGAFNDSIEDSLILAEWFDSCIDAHKKLGFESVGAKMAAHDPSDEGSDSKTYGMRHGSVLLKMEEKTTGNVNEGGHWATDQAIGDQVDHYTWDCDGMGVALREQTSKAFEGKHTVVTMFKGSEGVDFPESIFEPVEGKELTGTPIKNKDAIRNKRAQYYFELRKRIYNTHLAVTERQYFDPEKLISIDSSVKMLPKLRAELCRMPIKPNGNGLFELYTKEVMKSKFKFNSPNLADCFMMLMRQPFKLSQNIGVMPKPIKPMGRR